MKYTISGYNQTQLLKYSLDINDAVLLRTIADIYSSCSEKLNFITYENDRYIWLTYSYLAQEVPIVGSPRTIMRKMENLVRKNILKKIVLNSKDGKAGKFMFITLGENYKKLEEKVSHNQMTDLSYQVTECHKGNESVSVSHMTECHIKDPSIINPSIIIQNNLSQGEKCQPLIEDILKKYREYNLPKYKFRPKDYIVKECLDTLGAENLIKAFEIMSRNSFITKNFTVDKIFKVENLKKALNGSFKKFESTPKTSVNLQNDKVYDRNEEYENMMKLLGFSD